MEGRVIKTNLPVLLFLLFILRVQAWGYPGTGRASKDTNEAFARSTDVDEGQFTASANSLPLDFYTGQNRKNSECMLAYTEMSKYCGVESETKRMRLATLLTNCHLEAAGRKTIQWHPEDKLKYADKNEAALILQYVPLLTNICDRTGNGHDLALFRMQAETDGKLWSNIEELRHAVGEAREVNVETGLLTAKLQELFAGSLSWSTEIRNVSGELRSATDSLTADYHDLASMENKISATVQTLAQGNEAFSVSMANFLNQAYEHIESLGDKVDLQGQYNNLSISCANLQEEIVQCSRRVEECQNSFRIPMLDSEYLLNLLPKTNMALWLQMAHEIADIGRTWVMFPVVILKQMQLVKGSSWATEQLKMVIAVLQVPLFSFYIYSLYRILYFAFAVFEVWVPIRALIFVLVELIRTIILLFLYPSKFLYDCFSRTSSGSPLQPVNIEERHEGSSSGLATRDASFESRIMDCAARGISDERMRELSHHILSKLNDGLKGSLLEKLYRVEKRQIHIFRELQSIRGKPSTRR